MKQADLLQIMQDLGVSLPDYGTGVNRRIVSRDLEDAIGDYFFESLPLHHQAHMNNRMQIRPMKAFLFNKLKKEQQDHVLADNNEWVAEHKLNGFRMIISYIPEGYVTSTTDLKRYYGGNLSTVTLMPLDYTNHVLLTQPILFPEELTEPLLIDCEVICHDAVMNQDGMLSTDTREAVATILGSSPTEAMNHQAAGAKLIFCGFNVISPEGRDIGYLEQQTILQLIEDANEGNPHFGKVVPAKEGKLRLAKRLWKAGEEGIVLKNTTKSYVSGGRLRDVAVKLKRTHSGEVGDYVDAFISSYVLTKEHSKSNLIGGIILSVYVDDKRHDIATVSNMPDSVRKELTFQGGDGVPTLNPLYLNKVLAVDGQELSSRNMKLMHAVVEDWDFRSDKNASECVMELEDISGGMF